MDEKEYDIEIPVQPSWVWADFVQWRKDRYWSLRRVEPLNIPLSNEAKEEISQLVPSLEWIANKFKVIEFPCPGCQKIFPSFKTLTKHAPKKCAGPYRCWFEGYDANFSVPKVLESHVRSKHLPKEDLNCGGCGECFPKLVEFNAHIRRAEGNDQEQISSSCKEKAIICTRCRERVFTNYFSSQSVVDIHHRIKHGPWDELPFACTVPGCGRRYCAAPILTRHMKVSHNPEPPDVGRDFICDQCGKSFKFKCKMDFHIKKVHLCRLPGAKRYPCGICGNEMISQAKLNRHKQIHIRPEDAPWLCTLCGKRFCLREYLNIHMRSHDPERHLKYPHYQPKKKKAPGEPEKRGVAGAKIGRPPVKRSEPSESTKSKRKVSSKRKKKLTSREEETSAEETPSSSNSGSNSMEYAANSPASFNQAGNVNQDTTPPQFNFNPVNHPPVPLQTIDPASLGGGGLYPTGYRHGQGDGFWVPFLSSNPMQLPRQ